MRTRDAPNIDERKGGRPGSLENGELWPKGSPKDHRENHKIEITTRGTPCFLKNHKTPLVTQRER